MRIIFSFLLISILFCSNVFAAGEGPRIKSERFDDWYYRCSETVVKKKKSKRCEVVQIAQTKREKTTINLLTISLSRIENEKKKKQTVITVLAPLNVFLPAGMTLTVDKNKASGLKYRNCNKAGCWIQHLVNDKLEKQMSKGKFGFAKMSLINGQNINVKFSLKGLSKAMKAMESGRSPKV
ncbi:MAG: invasion associated locus B family protein [Methyloligellaceae bacterium]